MSARMGTTTNKRLRPLAVEIDVRKFESITGGAWEIPPDSGWRFRGICIDPARPHPGQVALSPDSRYGIPFHELRQSMGLSALMLPLGMRTTSDVRYALHRVPDVREALVRLAREIQTLYATPVIAVTGSVGKTTTSSLIEHLLKTRGCITSNRQRNQYDAVLAQLTNLPVSDYVVIETSLQALRDGIDETLEPDVAVLTQISPVHAGVSSDIESLAFAKARIFRRLRSSGAAVINCDIPCFEQVRKIAAESGASIITFGEDSRASFRLLGYRPESGVVSARINEENVEYELGIRVRHMALNSLAALAACDAAGTSWRLLIQQLSNAHPVHGRGVHERLKIAGIQMLLIDDSYNASPASTLAAFANLASIHPPGGGKRIAVLADMLELGAAASQHHTALLDPLLSSGVARVFLTGKEMRALWDLLPEHCRGAYSMSMELILAALARELEEGDVVLIKGSHGTGVHRIAADLRKLTLVPALLGGTDNGVGALLRSRHLLQHVTPHVPLAMQRWVSWQFTKLLETNTAARNWR